jgi:hypothetical protein
VTRPRRTLLALAIEALDDGRDPLDESFLAEHRITYDEVELLADTTVLGLRLLAWALDHPREASAALGGAGLTAQLAGDL